MLGDTPSEFDWLIQLRRQVLSFAGGALASSMLAALLLTASLEPGEAIRWLALACLGLLVQFTALWKNLYRNQAVDLEEPSPRLGRGTALTILRGVLVAWVAGFLAVPGLEGRAAWIPGVVFLLAITADYFDGYLARRQGLVTRLGEWLDLSLDAAAVLIGILVAVHFQRLPPWYLTVGLARYLFIAGLWLRQRSGLPIFALPESSRRRGFAGTQMVFIGILLLPLFGPPATFYVAFVFMAVFLGSFVYDWFLASRGGEPLVLGKWEGWMNTVHRVLPLVLRILAAALLVISAAGLLQSPGLGRIHPGYAWIEMLLAGMLLLGAAGRAAALLSLVLIGFLQIQAPLDPASILLIFFASLVFFTGTGAPSLWAPEPRFVEHKAGQAPVRQSET